MTTIVTACVAACLASYDVDESRYTALPLGIKDFHLSVRPDDSDISLLRERPSHWSSEGIELETPIQDLLLNDLHQHDFICLKPDDYTEKVQRIAQIVEISSRQGYRIFHLVNFKRHNDRSHKIEPIGEKYELLCRDRIASRCWVDMHEAAKADLTTSADIVICDECSMRRKVRHSTVRKLHKLKVLSLFGGAGGMDLGLSEASFRTEVMIDSDTASCTTFKKHHPSAQVIQADVGHVLRDGLIDDGNKRFEVIVMGPPCQSFSKLNRQDRQTRAMDPRSLCVATGLSYVELYKPSYGIIENVLGMLENGDLGSVPRNGIVKFILQCLASLNYNVRICMLRSNAFGVPQNRTRLVFLFAKNGVTLPLAPIGDYTSRTGPSKFIPMCVSDALSDLPRWEWANPLRYAPKCVPIDVRPAQNRPRTLRLNAGGQVAGPLWCPYKSEPQNQFQACSRRSRNEQVTQHYLLPPLCDPLLTAERVCHIRCQKGANHLDLASTPSLAMNELSCCMDDAVFANAFGRLDADGLFPTITTEINLRGKSGRMLLPDQNRLPSIRELARAQGFPDGITFCGTPSEILRQIGNAVPGPLALALGEAIMRAVTTDYLNGDTRFARES